MYVCMCCVKNMDKQQDVLLLFKDINIFFLKYGTKNTYVKSMVILFSHKSEQFILFQCTWA